MENAKIEKFKCDILGDFFKHCVVVLARKLLLFFPFRLPTMYYSIKSSLTAFNYSSIVTNVQVQDLVMLINDVARGQFEKQSCNT